MKELEVGFCAECASNIISRRLMMFWKCACISSVTDMQWIAFNQEDKITEKYIKALEAKKFIISTDHEEHILIRPHGVVKQADESFLVCLHPEEHFTKTT